MTRSRFLPAATPGNIAPRDHGGASMRGCRFFRGLYRVFALAVAFMGSSLAQAPTYSVGATPTGNPFTFLDARTNTIQGAMIDLLDAVASDAGFRTGIQATAFPALIPALTGKQIDIIAAPMLITAPRREVVDFSDPVFSYPEGLVVNINDKTAYRSLAELKGQVVGAQAGTVYVEFLKKNAEPAEVKVYDSLAELLREVSLGHIKAGVGDARIVRYQLARNAALGAKLVPTYEAKLNGSVGIAVRKSDTELLAKINASLAKLRANGTIDRILAKWGV
jgi:polar amino acid transport system substrate-binding protein